MNGQKFFRLTIILTIVALATGIGFPDMQGWAAGEKYPVRPIQVIVAYNPGSTDTYLRPFFEKMAEYLGQPLSFVYKPGAAGTIGFSFVAKSKPDGYIIFGCSTGPAVVGPITKEGLDYTWDSFAPIALFVNVPMGVAVKTDSPFKTIKDLVQTAKASPGKYTYSTSGVLGSSHFGMEMFIKASGVKLTHVPTTGSAPAATALLGGHVDMTVCDIGPLKAHMESEAFRMLGVMQKKRMKYFPSVPTFIESGFQVEYPLWYGIVAPKAVPKEVIDTLYGAAKRAVEEHGGFIEERLKMLGVEISLSTPEEMAEENRQISKSIQEIFKEIKGKS